MSVAEAAEVLELPEGTVKSRCSRARAQLAQVLRPGNPSGDPRVEDVDGTAPAAAAATEDRTTGRAGETA